MQRVPPDVCLDDNDGGEPPHWSTKLDGDYMGFQLVAGFKRGKPVLRQNARGGTDLLVQCQPRQLAYTKSFDDVTNSMRGLRSVLRGSPVYRDGGGYSLLNERGELAHADSPEAVYFYASLAPGFYVIEREPADNSYRLFWKDDRGTKQTALPTLEPEVLSR